MARVTPEQLLIAEQLGVALVRPEGGLFATKPDTGDQLAGALIAELVEQGHLDRREQTDDEGPKHRVRPLGGEPPADPLLAEVWHLAGGERRAAAVQRRVAAIAADRVYERLQQRELVSATPRRLLGPKWRMIDNALRPEIVAPLRRVVLDGATPDDHERIMIGLLQPNWQVLIKALDVRLGEWTRAQRHLRALATPDWPVKTAAAAIRGRAAAVMG